MKQVLLSFAGAILMLAVTTQADAANEYRPWVSRQGQPLFEAKYLTQSDTLVLFSRADGMIQQYAKSGLCVVDRTYLAVLPRVVSPYLSYAAYEGGKQAERRELLAFEKKQADITNTRLRRLEIPGLFARGCSYLATTELRKKNAVPAATKAAKPIITEREAATIRAELLAPTAAPTFKLEREIDPQWQTIPMTYLSSDGNSFAAVFLGRPSTIQIWDLNSGKLTHTLELPDPIAKSQFCISPRGNYLAYGTPEQHVVVYDIQNKKEVHRHKAAAWDSEILLRTAFNWAESEIYFLTFQGTCYRFPIAGGRGRSGSMTAASARMTPVVGLDISEDGGYVSVLTQGNHLLASPMPLPAAELGLGEKVKVDILNHNPEVSDWQGKVLNRGFVGSNALLRETTLYHDIKAYDDVPYKNYSNIGVAASRLKAAVFFADRAERYAWKLGAGPDGKLGFEVYDLTMFNVPVSIALPPQAMPNPPAVLQKDSFSAESRRYVQYMPATKKLQVYKAPEIAAPPAWKFHAELRRCLLDEDYDRLDKIVQPMFLDMRPLPGAISLPATTEAVYGFREYKQFVEEDDAFQKRIRAWQAAKPDSTLARLVVAYDAICRGFAARGNGFANTVSESGWRDLKKFGLEAEQVLEPLFELDKPPAEAYLFKLRVALMLGYDLEKQVELADGLIKVAPDYAPFHEQMMLNILPRWSGEEGDCEKYADHLAAKLGGEKGEIMYGRLAVELMKYHAQEKFVAQTNFDMPRAFKGLLQWVKKSPDDPTAALYVMLCYSYTKTFVELVTPELKDDFNAAKKSYASLISNMAWDPAIEKHHPGMRILIGITPQLLREE